MKEGGSPKVSTGDALELVAHLADLTSAEVPLAPGLRALALEMPRGRPARAIERLSAHLQQGVALDKAADMPDVRLPGHIRGLLSCGLSSGQLGRVLEQFLDHQRMAEELRRRLWSVASYPLMLLALLFGWCLFVSEALVPDLEKVFKDFDITVPAVTIFVFKLAQDWPMIVGWLLGLVAVSLLLTRGIGGRRAMSDLMANVPLIGKVWRDRGLAEFTSLLGLLLEHATPLPMALQLTAQGVYDGAVADACRRAARLADGGQSLSESIGRVRFFPPSLGPILAWGDRTSAQPEALRAATEMFRTRVELRAQFLSVVFPPLVFVIFGLTVFFVVAALSLPLLKLIRSLSM